MEREHQMYGLFDASTCREGVESVLDVCAVLDIAALDSSAIGEKRYKALAAQANVVYKSGRYIPAEQQKKGIKKVLDEKQQLTMFIDHPKGDTVSDRVMGEIKNVAAVVEKVWYQEEDNTTWIIFRVLKNRHGRDLQDLIDSDVQLGISQRAAAYSDYRTVEHNGQQVEVMYLEDMVGIYGYDIVQLHTANAGVQTEIKPLTDKVGMEHSMKDTEQKATPEGAMDTGAPEDKEPAVDQATQEKAEKEEVREAPAEKAAEATEDQAPAEKAAEATEGQTEKVAEDQTPTEKSASSVSQDMTDLQALVDANAKMTASVGGVLDRLMANFFERKGANYTIEQLARLEGALSDEVWSTMMWEENGDEKIEELGEDLKKLLRHIKAKRAEIESEGQQTNGQMDQQKIESEAKSAEDSKEEAIEAKAATDSQTIEVSADAEGTTKMSDKNQKETTNEKQAPAVTDMMDLQSQIKALQDRLAASDAEKARSQAINDAFDKTELSASEVGTVKGMIGVMLDNASVDQIPNVVSAAVEIFNKGKCETAVQDQGFNRAGFGRSNVQMSDNGKRFVDALCDRMEMNGNFQRKGKEQKSRPRAVQLMLDRYDASFGQAMRVELDRLGGYDKAIAMLDSNTMAEFNIPNTLARIVLEEAFVSPIFQNLIHMVMMRSAIDEIPYKRYNRENTPANNAFLPSLAQRLDIVVAELTAMPRAQIKNDLYPMQAVARKIETAVSDEWLSRVRRNPDLASVSQVISSMTEDVQRCMEQDAFDLMLQASLSYGATEFNFADETDGTATSFRVNGTDDSDCYSVVPRKSPNIANALEVRLAVDAAGVGAAGALVPEWGSSSTGGGPGSAFWYILNSASAIVQLVDANGDPSAPAASTGGNNFVCNGYKASGEFRFNMNAGSTEFPKHMNSLLFLVQKKLVRGHKTSGFKREFILGSEENMTNLTNAEAYMPASRLESAYNAQNAKTYTGNYGSLMGAGMWGSYGFSDSHIICSHSMGTIMGTFEPMHLKGPFPTRDTDGRLSAGEEYYMYREDSFAAPDVTKFGCVTLYNL